MTALHALVPAAVLLAAALAAPNPAGALPQPSGVLTGAASTAPTALQPIFHRRDRGLFGRDPFFDRDFDAGSGRTFVFRFGDDRTRHGRLRADRRGGAELFHFHFDEPAIVLFDFGGKPRGFTFNRRGHHRDLGLSLRQRLLIERQLRSGPRPSLRLRFNLD